jgi:hypothetical protein
MDKKKWYLSKSVWVGLIAFIGGILQAVGTISVPISPETQIMILGMIAFVLRLITKDPVEW